MIRAFTCVGSTGLICLATALRVHPAVTVLNLANNKFGAPGVQALASIIKHAPCLQRLSISNITLLDGGLILLASALRHNKTLIAIDMVGCDISDEGVQLAHAVQEHPALTVLDLSRNKIGDNVGTNAHELIWVGVGVWGMIFRSLFFFFSPTLFNTSFYSEATPHDQISLPLQYDTLV